MIKPESPITNKEVIIQAGAITIPFIKTGKWTSTKTYSITTYRAKNIHK